MITKVEACASRGHRYRNILSVVQAVFNGRPVFKGEKFMKAEDLKKMTLQEIFEIFRDDNFFRVNLSLLKEKNNV